MNITEHYSEIIEGLENLKYKSEYVTNAGDNPYKVQNLNLLRQITLTLENVPFINEEITAIRNSWLFQFTGDSMLINSTNNSSLSNIVAVVRLKLSVLKDIVDDAGFIGKEDVLFIKLPELSSFDELSKASTDLKKVIEIPIIDDSVNGHVKIIAAEKGSIILYAALGTITAVQLVAGICWSAMLIKKKNAEANIFAAHAKTLDLKNEMLQTLIDAQKQQIKNVLQSEAEAIALKFYSHNDPETIERLKLSISTASDLIEKGAKILPMGKNEEIQKAFPNYNATNLIESTIKQLKEN